MWCENRKRLRKNMNGKAQVIDRATGYLDSNRKHGFSADKRKLFIERLQICNNYQDISRSLGMDVQAFYDAIALDAKFREDVNAANRIEGRAARLNKGFEQDKVADKQAILGDLLKKASEYR